MQRPWPVYYIAISIALDAPVMQEAIASVAIVMTWFTVYSGLCSRGIK